MAEGPQHPTDEPLLKAADVARLLNVNRATLHNWVEAGLLPAVTLPSGHRRYRRSDIDAILATHDGAA